MDFEVPATRILHKELKPLDEDEFVVTYEYGWSESWEVFNAIEYKSQQIIGADLDLQDNCFSATVSLSFKSRGMKNRDDST